MKMAFLLPALLFVLHVSAAPARSQRSSFPRQAKGAATALKATQGKEFSSGYVFVDGQYVPPPYKVMRNGTVLCVNGIQVSYEIVPWSEFVQTQEGATATKKEIPQGDASAAPAESLASEPEIEAEEEEEDDDDSMSSLDDLFDDEPSVKKDKKKSSAKKKKKFKPKPKGPKPPKTVVVYSFEGEFKPNDETKRLVGRINDSRLDLDKKLRNGSAIFFGAKYGNMGRLELTSGPAKSMIERLPELLKSCDTLSSFEASCRQAGLTYFTHAMMVDLFRNRLQYQQLIERRKQDAKRNPWD